MDNTSIASAPYSSYDSTKREIAMQIRRALAALLIVSAGASAKAGEAGGKGDMENPEADLASCLRQKVVVTKAAITDRSSFPTGQFEITNGLSWPIGFVVIHYRITSAEREIPWDERSVGMDVRGGIAPGETRKVQATLNLDSDAPQDLELTGQVKDVADYEKRQLIGEPRYADNAEELSPLKCE